MMRNSLSRNVSVETLEQRSLMSVVPGSLDTLFSGDGKVTTDFGGHDNSGYDVVVSTGGRIVVGGPSYVNVNGPPQGGMSLVAYHSDGTLDTSFGSGGKAAFWNIASAELQALAAQPDGKIIAVGRFAVLGEWRAIIARYTTSGQLDTSFSGDGYYLANTSSDLFGFYDVALQPDGKIVAVGNGDSNLVLARFNANGSFDNSFDGNGRLGANFGANAYGKALDIMPNGKIVVTGYADDNSYSDLIVGRFNSNGTPDSTFSGDGKIRLDMSEGNHDYGNVVKTLSDGRILVAGRQHQAAMLWRFTAAGQPDNTFSGDGKLQVSSNGVPTDMILQNTGKILVLDDNFNLRRYTANGGSDSSWVNTPFGGSYAHAYGMAAATGDKVVVAGTVDGGSSSDFAVARYHAGSAPAAPNGLGASTVSSARINVNWNDNAINEQGQTFQRSANPSFTNPTVWSLGPNTESVNVNYLQPGTTYYFRVRATNAYGESTWSNIGSATTQSVTGQAVNVGPSADAHVRDGSNAAVNYGPSPELEVKSSSAGYNREAYLRFSLTGVNSISSAKLRLFGRLSQDASGVVTAVYGSSNTSWTETGLNWNTRPAIAGNALAQQTVSGTSGTWYEFDITSYLQQQKAAGATSVTLILRNTGGNSSYTIFNSDEAASNKPQLAIVT